MIDDWLPSRANQSGTFGPIFANATGMSGAIQDAQVVQRNSVVLDAPVI